MLFRYRGYGREVSFEKERNCLANSQQHFIIGSTRLGRASHREKFIFGAKIYASTLGRAVDIADTNIRPWRDRRGGTVGIRAKHEHAL